MSKTRKKRTSGKGSAEKAAAPDEDETMINDTEVNNAATAHFDTLDDEHIDDPELADLTPAALQQQSAKAAKSKQAAASAPPSTTSLKSIDPSQLLQELSKILHKNNTPLDHASRDDLLVRVKAIAAVLKELNEIKSSKIPAPLKELTEQLTSKPIMKLISSLSFAGGGDSKKSSSASQSANDELLAYLGGLYADLFRVYAPNPPYEGTILRNIFRHVMIPCISQLQNINHPLYPRYYYMLETMSQIKGWLVLSGESEYLQECVLLFDTFYQLINRPDISSRIEYWITDCMTAIIQECDTVPQEIIDTILLHLNPHNKNSRRSRETGIVNDDDYLRHTRAEDLSIKLINRCETVLQRPINNLLNDVFLKPHTVEKEKKERYQRHREEHEAFIAEHPSEFARETSFDVQVHVLYDLLAYCQHVLTPIQLQLEALLLVEEKSERFAYVTMFGRLLTRTDINYAKGNDRIIHEISKRIADADAEIRCVMMNVCSHLLVMHEQHRLLLCEKMVDQLKLNNEVVRVRCIQALLKVAKRDLSYVTESSLFAIGERLLDYKKPVRTAAAEGLATLFGQYAAPAWRQSKPLSDEGKKLAWVPRKFTLVAALSTEMAVYVDKLFDEIFLGRKVVLHERNACLVGMFVGISGHETRNAFFTKILMPKQQTQLLTRAILQVNTQLRLAANQQQKDLLQHLLRARIHSLAKYFIFDDAEGTVEDYYDIFLAIVQSRDKNIQKYLSLLSDPTTEYSVIRSASSEFEKAVARSGSATASSSNGHSSSKKLSKENVARRLVITLSLAVLPRDALPLYFDYVKQQVDSKRTLVYRAALELLLGYSNLFSENFYESYEQLYDLCQPKDEAAGFAVQILSNMRPTAEHPLPSRMERPLLQLLRDMALTGTPLQSKFAIKAIHALYSEQPQRTPTAADALTSMQPPTPSSAASRTATATGDDTASKAIREILQKYVHALIPDNVDQLANVMSGLSQIARFYPPMFEGYRDLILPFMTQHVFPLQDMESVETRQLAIATLVEFARTYDDTRDTRTLSVGRNVLRLLITLIQNDGKLAPSSKQRLSLGSPGSLIGDGEVTELSADRVAVLQAVATGCVDMMTCAAYRRMLITPPQDAHALHPHSDKNPQQQEHKQHTHHPYPLAAVALLGEHPSADVRNTYAHRFTDSLGIVKTSKDKKILLYWSYMLVFVGALANDPKTMAKLKFNTKRSRELVSERQLGRKEAKHGKKDPHQQNDLSEYLPEIWLLDFLYLLSYHPNVDDTPYKDTADKFQVYDLACKYIEYMLDALCETVELGSNFGLISQVISTIRHYEDVRNPAKKTVYKLVDLTSMCLRHRMSVADRKKSAWDMTSSTNQYGNIMPPSDMYQKRADGPYLRALIPDSYKPPRQRKDEERKHKTKNAAEHAAHHELTSPSKKRKGSVASVESSSRQTSPSRRTPAKKAKKQPAAAESEQESEAEEPVARTPTRELLARAKKGTKSYQDIELSDVDDEEEATTMSTMMDEEDLETMASQVTDVYAPEANDGSDVDKENVADSNRNRSKAATPRSSAKKSGSARKAASPASKRRRKQLESETSDTAASDYEQD